MKTCVTLLCVFIGISLSAEEAPPPSDPADVISSAQHDRPPAATPSIEHGGQTFELANSSANKNVETDEYVVTGEKLGDWTQLLTVQRLTLSHATGTDEFLAYFNRRVGEDSASLEVLKQGKAASVFAVRFPKSDGNEEQVMICLAFVEPGKPLRLNVVQYAIKPTRCSLSLVEMRIRSWRDKFLGQAQMFAGATGRQ